MRYRFYITITSRVEAHPLNWLKCSLVDTKEQMYYRRKFNGTLTFTDNNGSADFTMLLNSERANPCRDILFEIEERANGVYYPYWRGRFATTDGRFDLDRCTFEITPLPLDVYTPFDKEGDTEYNILAAGLQLVATRTYFQTYSRNLWLMDVIEYLVHRIAPTANVVSNFLTSAVNPVLGGVNQYNQLTIAQKSDIKRPGASNPAAIGMMSFNQMMEILKMYNLWWSYDGTTFRIEHYDYWGSSAGLDLRGNRLSAASNKYEYESGEMPRFERFRFMEAEDGNYVDHTITYDPICVRSDIEDILQLNVTTDIDYIRKCASSTDDRQPSDIEDKGWVILANFYDGSVYRVYYGTSFASANASHNYLNGWAHLLRSFFMHGRVLLRGLIQRSQYDFISVRKTKLQRINAAICRSDGYRPDDYLTTTLGEKYFGGQKGSVKEAAIHPDGLVEFQLLYGEDKNMDVQLPERPKTIQCIITLPRTINTYLSEANTRDTYYTVLFDEGTDTEECFEVLIPAGAISQTDIAGAEHTTIDGINTSHDSLTGWYFVFNNNQPWTEITDCGTPPPDPVYPPTAPVMTAATQGDQWESVYVYWGSVVDAMYYELYRSIDGGDYVYVDMIIGSTTYIDAESTKHTYRPARFCYKVKACNSNGCSAMSSVEVCTDVNTA